MTNNYEKKKKSLKKTIQWLILMNDFQAKLSLGGIVTHAGKREKGEKERKGERYYVFSRYFILFFFILYKILVP